VDPEVVDPDVVDPDVVDPDVVDPEEESPPQAVSAAANATPRSAALGRVNIEAGT
jgi:hypothetical protein